MEMKGEYRIPAPRPKVWDALNDPEILKQCIAGCQSLDKTSDSEFSAQVRSKVGPVSAKFSGKVSLSDINPPESYTISGEGTGGVAGFAKGGASVHLAEDGTDTVLTYNANATVGGKLAQIGSRLIDSTAKKMADDFFGKFAEIVGGDDAGAEPAAAETATPAEAPAASAPAAAPASEPTATPPQSAGTSPMVWVGGLIAAVVVIVVLLQVMS